MRKVCGLDVHKDRVFMCILSDSGEKIQQKFGVLTPDLDSLRDLLVFHGVGDVAMESTSIYWMPVWRVLESDFDLKLVNPYFIKQLPGKKSDVKDAEWIAICLQKDLIRGSYVPSEIIQRLRQLNRRIFDLNKEIVHKLNKLDSCLQRCNIRISNYVSSIDSKSYKGVVERLCEGVTDPKELVREIHGRTINRIGRDIITASLTGVISSTDVDVIGQLKEELKLAEKHKDECQQKMNELCQEHFPHQLSNLQTIPGIKERSATAIIAELGVDMKMFLTASALVSWCGLKPRNEESAGKIKSRRITHGNKYLRKTLIECAWAAGRTQGCFFNKFSYTQIVVRKKQQMKVRVAVARKILTVIWHILSKDEQYREILDHQASTIG
jgi:transposase